ncbi:MAG: hypothetical protein H0W88_11425 [Parachlamydiaceae bacterium]|nr:hypothetical protein [Parachlamydiaceae bacterium]
MSSPLSMNCLASNSSMSTSVCSSSSSSSSSGDGSDFCTQSVSESGAHPIGRYKNLTICVEDSVLPKFNVSFAADNVLSSIEKTVCVEDILKKYKYFKGENNGAAFDGCFDFTNPKGVKGIGRVVFANGCVREGVFKNGVLEGPGVSIHNGVVKIGNFSKGFFGKIGTLHIPESTMFMPWKMGYKGTFIFVNGLCHGIGTVKLPDGTIYEGEFEKGLLNGKGRKIRYDKKVQEGIYCDGRLQHKDEILASYTPVSKEGVDTAELLLGCEKINVTIGGIFKYKGLFKFVKGVAEGKGRITNLKTGEKLSGYFKGGMLTGEGSRLRSDGIGLYGNFVNGLLHGRCSLISDNKIIYQGQFVNGEFLLEYTESMSIFTAVEDPLKKTETGTLSNIKILSYSPFFHTETRKAETSHLKLMDITDTGGNRCEGYFRFSKGKIEGFGRVTKKNRDILIGMFVVGFLTGNHARRVSADGTVMNGHFEKNHLNGIGMKILPNKSVYMGNFLDGELIKEYSLSPQGLKKIEKKIEKKVSLLGAA